MERKARISVTCFHHIHGCHDDPFVFLKMLRSGHGDQRLFAPFSTIVTEKISATRRYGASSSFVASVGPASFHEVGYSYHRATGASKSTTIFRRPRSYRTPHATRATHCCQSLLRNGNPATRWPLGRWHGRLENLNINPISFRTLYNESSASSILHCLSCLPIRHMQFCN